jgi:hypothetical protein
LLNLTDGLLGQGRNVLVAITTNEDLAALHPAVVRPGRSLAHLEVGRLTPLEAAAWLDNAAAADAAGAADGVAGGAAMGESRARMISPVGATLAELFAIRAGTAPASVTHPTPNTGLYL